MATWTMGGHSYPYAPRVMTERDIELPWAASILRACDGEILEVGDATSRAIPDVPRTIVDRWEPGPGPLPVTHHDIVGWDGGPYGLILSVSTFEHVGIEPPEEHDPDKAARAIEHCLTLLAPGGELAFTIPCGYHPQLDAWVLAREWTDIRLMGREDRFSAEWHELALDFADCPFPHEWCSAKCVLFVRHRRPA